MGEGRIFHFLLGDSVLLCSYSFKRQRPKKVKHTETIRRLLPTNSLSVFDHFMGLPLKS